MSTETEIPVEKREAEEEEREEEEARRSLHLAGSNAELIRRSIEQEKSRDTDAFLKAAKYGDMKRAQQLLDKGVDIESRDSNCWTAAECAAAAGHVELCEFLLKVGERHGHRDEEAREMLKLAKKAIRRSRSISPFSDETDRLMFCETCTALMPDWPDTTHVCTPPLMCFNMEWIQNTIREERKRKNRWWTPSYWSDDDC